MLTITPASVKIDNIDYEIELGKAKSTMIGYEDHGMFCVDVEFEFSSAGQSLGGRLFDHPEEFLKLVKTILKVFQVCTWEDIKGREVYVLRTETYGIIRGLMSKDQQSYVIFSDLFKDKNE